MADLRQNAVRVVQSALGRRSWVAAVCVVAVLLTAGSVRDGLSRDDYVHVHMVRGDNALLTRTTLELFRTDKGEPALVTARMEAGVYPWFTAPDLRLGFFRPLASLTHAVDYALFPEHAAWMHVQNLAWYVALVAIAALLYRRVLGSAWAAGLAALLFAVDDAHGSAVGWVAGRNGLMAGAFGFAALLLHDVGARERRSIALYLAPGAFALALLSGELGLGALGWLIAYTLWMEPQPWRARILRLAPYLAVAAAWSLAYVALGYGARSSGYYVDPISDLALFARAVAWNGPKLLGMLFSVPPAMMPPIAGVLGGTGLFVAQSLAAVLVGAALVIAIVRDRSARFLATGMVLSIAGVCGTMPDARLLLLASFGAMGLCAMTIVAALDPARATWLPRKAMLPVSLAAALLFALHAVLSPLAMPASASLMAALHRAERQARASAPVPPVLENTTIVLLNAPHAFVPASWFVREDRNDPVPRRVRGLHFGPGPVFVHRPDASSVTVSPATGFLSEPVSWLYRRPGSFAQPGATIPLSDVTVHVDAVTRDGRPATVTFRFAGPVGGDDQLWLAWKAGRWVRFEVPSAGGTTRWDP